LIVNDQELLVTPVQPDTLAPTWPNQRRGNYRVPVGSRVRVELWDSNPINNHPICVQEVRELHQQVSSEARIELKCDSGAYVELVAEPAHGKLGAGLFYEMRTDQVFVVRVLRESPAARAGIKAGQEITRVMGESTRGMSSARVRSLINANTGMGVKLELRDRLGDERQVVLKDGAIYPWVNEDLP
jgi:predicted metalloprotease with PDZ domain